MSYRVLTNILLIFAVAMAPWWIVAGVVLVSLFAFRYFYEALVAGIALDSLYGAPRVMFGVRVFVFLAAFALALVLIEVAKTLMRMFEEPERL
jgi:hypothetical protein